MKRSRFSDEQMIAIVKEQEAGMATAEVCRFAWNRLMDQPWRIMSIGLRQWAHG